MPEALEALSNAARAIDSEGLGEEYDAIFLGVGKAQVDPCASKYANGTRGAQALLDIRAALREHGLARRAGIAEGEDHLGSLCEAMRVLIGSATPIPRQRAFFETHLLPWHRACTADIRGAEGANFYRCVANVIEAYFDVERESLAMEEEDDA